MKTYSYKVWHPDIRDHNDEIIDGSQVYLEFLRRDNSRKPFITGSFGDSKMGPLTYRLLLSDQDITALKLSFPKIHINRSRKKNN